jgi:CheY-like chemotaxis protein
MAKAAPPSEANRILIVDDEQLVVCALAHMLRNAGYYIDVARNGREALARVSAEPYDLIICDVAMPVMDGEAFYRQLSSSRPSLSQRVVFCTGDMSNPATRRFLEASGAPVIRKPFRLPAVLDMVTLTLAQNRLLAPTVG